MMKRDVEIIQHFISFLTTLVFLYQRIIYLWYFTNNVIFVEKLWWHNFECCYDKNINPLRFDDNDNNQTTPGNN